MNKDQLDLLKKSVESFNKYREDNPRAYIDLENARMQRWRLNRANLKDANLKNAILSDAHFDSANLANANISEADCTNCSFLKANLNGANLRDANLTMCIFEKTSAIKTDFRDAKLVRAEFNQAILESADFRNAQLTGADLTDADLRGVKLKGAILKDAKIDEAALAENENAAKSLTGEQESSNIVNDFTEELKNPETKEKAQWKIVAALFFLAVLITLTIHIPGWLNKPGNNNPKGLEITGLSENYQGSQPQVEGFLVNQTGKTIPVAKFVIEYKEDEAEGKRPTVYTAKIQIENLQPGEKRLFRSELPAKWKQGMKREIIWIPQS